MGKQNPPQGSQRHNSVLRPELSFFKLFSSPWRRSQQLGRTATTAYSRAAGFITQDIRVQFTVAPHAHQPEEVTSSTEHDHEARRLTRLINRSADILATATTVFPFDLFPDTITVDRNKITIIKRDFLWSEKVISIRIEDILNVATSVGPLFGSLIIASRVMSTEDHFTTSFFWKRDAIYLKHIIQGYVIARHNKIKTSHLSKNELIDTLAKLGHDKSS
jgi:hypothetical protein